MIIVLFLDGSEFVIYANFRGFRTVQVCLMFCFSKTSRNCDILFEVTLGKKSASSRAGREKKKALGSKRNAQVYKFRNRFLNNILSTTELRVKQQK